MATEYKLSYTAQDINNRLGKIDSFAEKSEIPSKTSELANDSVFITGRIAQSLTEEQKTQARANIGAIDASEIPKNIVQTINGIEPDENGNVEIEGATEEQIAQIEQNSTDIATLNNGKVANSGWSANKYIGTDTNGNVVEKDAPSAGTDNWELLNTITVSDDATTNVTFTQDSNGNPLSLKKFYLKVTGINGAFTYPALRLNNLLWTEQFGGVAAGNGTNLTMPVLFQILGDGCYCCEWFHPYAQTLRFDGEKTPHGAIQSNIASVTSIYWCWGAGSAITNGAVFELYGVRA